VPVVPQLGGDPQLAAPDAAGHYLAEGFPDTAFVTVDGSAIEMTVANGGRGLNGFGHLFGADVVGTEGA
jgi:hypothetical protein